MASAWRVVAFFVIVFLVPVLLITLPLYARYTLYPARLLALSPADTLDLHAMASSFWCQGQRLSSNGTFDAYLLDRQPRIDKRRHKLTRESKVIEITEEIPSVRTHHLLKGSEFTLDVCARWPGGVMIVVRGIDNFKSCFYKEEKDLEDLQQEELAKLHKIPVSIKTNSSGSTVRLNPKFPAGASTPKLHAKPALDIGNEDVISEHDDSDSAKEIFDLEKGVFSEDETWVLDSNANKIEATTVRLLDTNSRSSSPAYATESASKMSPSTTRPALRKEEEPKTPETVTPSDVLHGKIVQRKKISEDNKQAEELHNNNLAGDDSGNGEQIFRSARSISAPYSPIEQSDEIVTEERKMKFLHSVDDSFDVTAGNSSISSSEEFMARCTNTILYVDIARNFECSSQDMTRNPKWHFRVNETDDYFFLFLSDNSIEMNLVKYYLEVDRVMYNVASNKESCNGTSECAFPLSFLGSDVVVVEMQDPVLQNLLNVSENYETQAICQPRVAVYLIFILLVPFIILLFAFQ